MHLPSFLQFLAEYRDYVWGGQRLRPGPGPTAEVWMVYEANRVSSGEFTGRTLSDLTLQFGPALLGPRAFLRAGGRFPLLVKLLDCAQWLSIQLHPNDVQAASMVGPSSFGKTEVWHFLDAVPDAQIIAGLEPGYDRLKIEEAVRNGHIQDFARYLPVHSGDTLLMLPGTLHALGPGLLLYELQQTSDITYRVYDWGRPLTGGRQLHIEQSLAVIDPDSRPQLQPLPLLTNGKAQTICQSPHFILQLLELNFNSVTLDTVGETFHIITVVQGQAKLWSGQDEVLLKQFQSALVPASTGAYTIDPDTSCRLLIASP